MAVLKQSQVEREAYHSFKSPLWVRAFASARSRGRRSHQVTVDVEMCNQRDEVVATGAIEFPQAVHPS